jgi:hypothetical protein
VEKQMKGWLGYTLWRVLFVVIAWFIIQLATPLRGIWAIALAIVVSGIFSIVFLGRQRDAMSTAMFGFFRGINERIDAAAAKEDFDEPELVAGDGDTQTQEDTEAEQEDSR